MASWEEEDGSVKGSSSQSRLSQFYGEGHCYPKGGGFDEYDGPKWAACFEDIQQQPNRSVTESHMLPRSSRKLRMSLHCTGGIAQVAPPEIRSQKTPLSFLLLTLPVWASPGLGGKECALSRSSPRDSISRMELLRNKLSWGRRVGRLGWPDLFKARGLRSHV